MAFIKGFDFSVLETSSFNQKNTKKINTQSTSTSLVHTNNISQPSFSYEHPGLQLFFVIIEPLIDIVHIPDYAILDMHLSTLTSMIATLYVLPLTSSLAFDKSKVTRGAVLQPRDNFEIILGESEFCQNSATQPDKCLVAYNIPTTQGKNKTPVDIRSYEYPCNDALFSLNKDKSHKHFALDEAFDYSTIGMRPNPKYQNITVSFAAYGDLKGKVHTPVIKIGDTDLAVTSVSIEPDTFETAGSLNSVMWGAVYDCKV